MPSYQFNNFTGRLRESTHFQPLYPISATPLHTADPPKMIYDTIKTRPVAADNSQSSRAVHQDGKLPEKMLKTMRAYQQDLEAPVYLIRGTPDKILFGATCLGVGVCLTMSFAFIIKKAFPNLGK